MPFLFKRYYPLRNILFFVGEGLLIFSIITLVQIIIGCEWTSFSCQTEYVFRSALVTAVFLLSLYFFDLYDLGVLASFTDTSVRVTQAFGVGCIVLAAFYYVFPSIIISMSIPTEFGHPFQSYSATHSDLIRPPIPKLSGHHSDTIRPPPK